MLYGASLMQLPTLLSTASLTSFSPARYLLPGHHGLIIALWQFLIRKSIHQVAGHEMVWFNLHILWWDFPAAPHGFWAALPKTAARGWVDGAGCVAWQNNNLPLLTKIDIQDGRNQGLGVGVHGIGEDLVAVPRFHHFPQ